MNFHCPKQCNRSLLSKVKLTRLIAAQPLTNPLAGDTRMLKHAFIAIGLVTAISGCASNSQNPLDRVTYRGEPLVKDVKHGMSQERVLAVGGEPSSVTPRTARPGLCQEYVLYHDGHETPYFVAFDASGHVDGKGFLTCAQMEENQR